MPHTLTPAQAEASESLVDWYESGESKEVIVWAVCGAGKTEVSYGVIHYALAAGKRVMYAAPRRDVVCGTVSKDTVCVSRRSMWRILWRIFRAGLRS